MRKVPVLTLVSLAVVAAFVVAPAQAQLEVMNGAVIDDNNRIVGMDGNNMFLLGLAPNESVMSIEALGMPAGGGNGTPDGGTVDGAALFVSIADMDRNVVANGDNTATVEGALEATLNGDGSYAVENLGGLDAPHFVTFGAMDATESAGATVLAAPATNVELAADAFSNAPAGSLEGVDATFADGAASFELAEGQGTLYFANAAVEAGEYVTVSCDYEADAVGGTIAVVAFPGGVSGAEVQYMQIVGEASMAAGVTKNIAVTFKNFADSVVPGFQVTGPGNVTISNLQVIEAGPLAMYAVEALDVDLSGDWNFNVNGQDVGEVTVDGDSLSIMGSGGADTLANAFKVVSLEGGAVSASLMASAAAEGGVLATVITNGASTVNSYVPTGTLAEEMEVVIGGTLPAGDTYVVVQSSVVDATVSGLSVSEVEDGVSAFDENLVP